MILLPVTGNWRITQGFGENALPFYRKIGLEGHNGIDFVSDNETIYAPHDGYLTIHHSDKGYGIHVRIRSLPYKDGESRDSILAHLSDVLPNNNQFVYAGDPVGIMGSTGNSTGVHLHWTYKVYDDTGDAVHQDNGYRGALDIYKYCVEWKRASTISWIHGYSERRRKERSASSPSQ